MIFGLYGAGGFGREIMPFIRQQYGDKCFFIETNPTKDLVNGVTLISEKEFFAKDEEKMFNVAIADSKVREDISNRCILAGCVPGMFYGYHSMSYGNNEIGEGAILCANTTITSNVKIGKFFHANIYSYVGHDCVIGDYVTFSPRVSCNGNVVIGNHVFVGTGAIILPEVTIGDNAVIGASAVVIRDVLPWQTVIGNPGVVLQ